MRVAEHIGHISIVFWLVQAQFRYMLIIGKWYRLATGQWYMLVQVYSGISHSDNVAVVSSFDTYISRWKDGARIGGCSHLLVVAEEHRGLYPPSGCSQRIGEL
jgi:hypothetical protein